MKVIDLLNKIANGEEVPKEIIYNGYNYLYHTDYKSYYRSVVGSNWIALTTDFSICTILNDTVEILEEEKKIPEKLSTWFSVENVQNNGVDKTEFIIKYANHNFETYFNKINEIIDYLKSKGE